MGDWSPDNRSWTRWAAIVPELSAFGQDQRGELHALSLAGAVYKLEP